MGAKPTTIQHLRIDPPDLAIAARLAGFDTMAKLSKEISRNGEIEISPANLSQWSREKHAPLLTAWRVIEDFLSGKGVTSRDIAEAKNKGVSHASSPKITHRRID